MFVCLCPNRDSGDFLCVLVVCGVYRSSFVECPPVDGADDCSKGEGWQTQRRGGWMAGQARMEEVLANAVVTDGRKE